MRCSGQIQWIIGTKTVVTPKICSTTPKPPPPPCRSYSKSLINAVKSHSMTALCFQLAKYFDWSRWAAITSLPPILRSQFLWVRLEKSTQTWMWEIFLEGHILSTVGDALTTTSSQLVVVQFSKYVTFSKHLQFSTEIHFSYK
jgi:hypothetical protein